MPMGLGMVAFKLGPVPVYTYGLLVSLTVIVSFALAWLNFRIHGESTGHVTDLLLLGLPFAVVGARAGYVLHYPEQFASWQEALAFWQGGLSPYGGVTGFLLAVVILAAWRRHNIWRVLDLLAPALVFALVLTSLGSFALQLTLGTPFVSDLPNDHMLAEYVEFSYRPAGWENSQYFHRVALYQAMLQLVVFLVLAWKSLRLWRCGGRYRAGCTFFGAVAAIALIRLVCGFFYLTTEPGNLFLPGRLMAAGTFLAAMLFYLWRAFGSRFTYDGGHFR